MQSEALHEEGRTEEGLAVLAEALALVRATEERFHEAELYRLQGLFLLASAAGGAARARAEASFRQALTVARRRGVELGMAFRAGTSVRAHQKAAGAARRGAWRRARPS